MRASIARRRPSIGQPGLWDLLVQVELPGIVRRTAEAQYRLPVDLWKQTIDLYYPNKAWVCLERDVFERLDEYRRRMGCPTWEKALESALNHAEQEA